MIKNRKTIFISSGVLTILIVGYLALDRILYNGIRPKPINENGIKADLFIKKEIKNQPAIILVGGGIWGNYWGQELAKKDYIGLSLPYYRHDGLPKRMEEIPLEYFERTLHWLGKQPEVNPNKIIVMGASRNAELALLIASYFPNNVHGVIVYNPSSVSWSNTVLPFNSDSVKPGWTFKSKPIPFIPMEKIKDLQSTTIETLEYWKQGLSDSVSVNSAFIPVENINGPILILSGKDDKVWPSALMSDMIENVLNKHNFKFEFENIQYENAGHLLSSNPNVAPSVRKGEMTIDGRAYDFNYGGTEVGDIAAQKDASMRVFKFISKFEND